VWYRRACELTEHKRPRTRELHVSPVSTLFALQAAAANPMAMFDTMKTQIANQGLYMGTFYAIQVRRQKGLMSAGAGLRQAIELTSGYIG